jgi:hypothetical protein
MFALLSLVCHQIIYIYIYIYICFLFLDQYAVTLLVLDECYYTMVKRSYVQLMAHYRESKDRHGILGLGASIVAEKCCIPDFGVEKCKLEMNMDV